MKKRVKHISLLLILFISIGFAVLSRQLNINGVISMEKSEWNIYFDNIQIAPESVTPTAISISNNCQVDYSVYLKEPGDFFEFTIEGINDGNINAMINSISMSSLTNEQKKVFDYKVSYISGNEIKKYDILPRYSKRIYKIKLEYKQDIEKDDLLESEQEVNLSFELEYIKDNSEVIDDRTSVEMNYYLYTDEITGGNENVKKILRHNVEPDSNQSTISINSDFYEEEPEYPISMWYDSANETLYYYTAADIIYLEPERTFNNYSNLEEIDLKTIYFKGRQLIEIFQDDKKLKNIDLRHMDLQKVLWIDNAFKNCESLNNLLLPAKKMKKLLSADSSFCNCPAFDTIDKTIFPEELLPYMNQCSEP